MQSEPSATFRYATRLNSFREWFALNEPQRNTVPDAIAEAGKVEGLHSLELNYPEHFTEHTVEELRERVDAAGLVVTGINVRWPAADFGPGAFSHPDAAVRTAALRIVAEAVEVARELAVDHVILWPAHDGFEYPFQLDYSHAWNNQVECYRRAADDAGEGMRLSIEYKPSEPRSRTTLGTGGMTLAMVQECDRENLGLTFDFCHMLMSHESPGMLVDLALSRGKLYGLHMNDGYGVGDDGLMVASVNLPETLEMVVALVRHQYAGTVYFDTEPRWQDPIREAEINIRRMKDLAAAAGRLRHPSGSNAVSDLDPSVAGEMWWTALVGAGSTSGDG